MIKDCRMSYRTFVILICVAVTVLLAGNALAQAYRNMSSVHDGSGRMSTNTVTLPANGDGTPVAFKHISAAGQPGGIQTNANGAMKNYAGFLQAVDIKKWNQTDIYGNPYELTPDNDVDGLTDIEEVEGSGFSPGTPTGVNNPDTDGDGVPDGGEAAGGTNPTNENSYLQIVSIKRDGEQVVHWTARGDGSVNYRLRYEDAKSDGPPVAAVDIGTASGGSAPWFETVAGYTNASATDMKIYAVEASPAP